MTNSENAALISRLQTGRSIALSAGEVILRYFQNPDLIVENKHDLSPVTIADREAEATLRGHIQKQFPDDAIIGEEGDPSMGKSGYTWILDPIDGTQSFACGVPLFGVLIGITYNEAPVAGVVHFPALSETFFASHGTGAFWQTRTSPEPRRIHVSQTASLKKSLFCTTSHSGFARIGRRDLFDKLLASTRKFRGWEGCYAHMLVASGRADLMVDPDVKIWDCAAIAPILREAGGSFFDLRGKDRIDSGSAISCNRQLRDELVALINS